MILDLVDPLASNEKNKKHVFVYRTSCKPGMRRQTQPVDLLGPTMSCSKSLFGRVAADVLTNRPGRAALCRARRMDSFQ